MTHRRDDDESALAAAETRRAWGELAACVLFVLAIAGGLLLAAWLR